MAQLMASPFSYFADSNGAPLAGGKVYTYVAGSGYATPKASYTDSTGTVSAANPVVLDSAGRAAIWLAGSYGIKVTDSLGNVISTNDPVTAGSAVNGIPWAVASGTADAITATYNPANTQLVDGLQLAFRATAPNATTTPTFSPDTLTPHTITQKGGQALGIGSIPGALAECIVELNLANTRWELLNPAVLSILTVKRQTFTSTGTYTPSAGMIYCDIEIWAGGGGGAGVSNQSAQIVGAGGGAGGYARKTASAATIGASQAVTIGAAGAAGANTGATGGTGGTTSVGSIVSATGGLGGVGPGSSTGLTVLGGAGGVGSSGDINATGAPGGTGSANAASGNPVSGFGASTSLGGGGIPVAIGNNGTNGAANSGAGGSGAACNGSSGAKTGGTGGAGYAVITEYCSQ